MKYKVGQKYNVRCDMESINHVEILAIDTRLPQPVVGIVIEKGKDGTPWVRCWHRNGHYYSKIQQHPMDLTMEIKKAKK